MYLNFLWNVGILRRNLGFFMRRRRPVMTFAGDTEQQAEHIDGCGSQTDAKCEPIPAELASKSAIK